MEKEQPFKKIIHFPGLNGLRFLAALAVVVTHIELIKGNFGIVHFWKNPLIFNLGSLGVYFFFVLSGFLITYLLLVEKENHGSISIKNFYLRRVLRIWPLYYFILILGFFVLTHFTSIRINYLQTDFETYFNYDLLFYLLILPNIAFSFSNAVPHIGQMWSIGVEEQFYLFWPLLIKFSRNILRALILVFVFFVVIKASFLFLPESLKQHQNYEAIKRFLAMTKMELMAIGGIGAYYLYHNRSLIEKFLFSKSLQIVSYLIIPILVFITPDKLQDGIHIVYSFFFLVIILNVSTNEASIIKLNNRFFNYFGNISYGIYMYHLMIIPIVLVALKGILPSSVLLQNMIIYPVVIALTLLVSAISYKWLESPFIRLKRKFEIVRTNSSEINS